MKLLIVGGTLFLGRHLVAAAAARGHEIATFNRGRHQTALPPGVESLKGDRNSDVSALRGRKWDAAVDTSGYVPGSVNRIMDALVGAIAHYTFVSSVSAYGQFSVGGIDEHAPVATITADQLRDAEEAVAGRRSAARAPGEMYGALKALCEQAAEHRMPGRVLNVRPGLIVGPDDYTDRFTYWVRRAAAGGGDVLAPGAPGRRVRVIDVRDLAAWILRMVEDGRTGLFNATGAEDGLSFGRMLDVCRSVSRSSARFKWVDEAYLLDRGVQPWSELPLWIPAADNGIFEVRNDRAIAAGLTFRPLETTVRDTLEWDRGRAHASLKAGLTRDREGELLADAPYSSH